MAKVVPTLVIPLLWWRKTVVNQLTERERHFVGLVAAGLTNAQIARLECVEAATVRAHVYNIMRKLGVRNRTQLAMVGLLAGLVDVSEVVELWRHHELVEIDE